MSILSGYGFKLFNLRFINIRVKEAQKKKEQIELQMKRKAEVQMQLAGGGVEPSAKSARSPQNNWIWKCIAYPCSYCCPHACSIGGTRLVLLVNMVGVALVASRTRMR